MNSLKTPGMASQLVPTPPALIAITRRTRVRLQASIVATVVRSMNSGSSG